MAKNIDIVIDAKDNASRVFGKVEASSDRLANSMRGAAVGGATLLASGMVAASAAVTAGGVASLSAASSLETLKAALLTSFRGAQQEADAAYQSIFEFAKKTPYALQEVVSAFLRLKNAGLTPSEAALTSYGNTASSMSKSLMQMVEAVADATNGEFVRLQEFGIRAKKEGEQVTFMFQGVKETVGFNAQEIENYLIRLGETKFSGGMELQSTTLAGKFSTLKDNVSQAFSQMANDTGLLSIVSQGVGSVNENMQGWVDTILNSVVPAIQNAGNWYRAHQGDIRTIAVVVRDFLKPNLDLLIHTWNHMLLPALERGKPVLSLIAGMLGSTLLLAISAASLALTSFVAGIATVINWLQWLYDKVAGAWAATANFRVSFGNMVSDTVKGLQTMYNFLSNVYDKFAQIRDIGRGVAGIFNSIKMPALQGLANILPIPRFATGGDFITRGPQMIMVGDNPGGQERVQVTPLSSQNINGPQGGGVSMVNNFNVTNLTDAEYTARRTYQLLATRS